MQSIPPSFYLSDMFCCMIAERKSSVFGFQFLSHVSRRGSQTKKEHRWAVSVLGLTGGKVEHHGLWNKLCWELRAHLSLPLKFQRKSFFLSKHENRKETACYFSIPVQNSLKGNGNGWGKHLVQFQLEVQADIDLAPDSLFFSFRWWLNSSFTMRNICNVSVLQMVRGEKGLCLDNITSCDCHSTTVTVVMVWIWSVAIGSLPLYLHVHTVLEGSWLFCDFRSMSKWCQEAGSRSIWFNPACFPSLPLLFSPSWHDGHPPHFCHHGLRGSTNDFPVKMGWNPQNHECK